MEGDTDTAQSDPRAVHPWNVSWHVHPAQLGQAQ